MAKKRKLSSVPSSRTKEIKDVRELNEDLSQQSEVGESEVEHPKKVSSARENLKSVLQELLVISDESSDEPPEDKEDKDSKEKDEELSKAKESKKDKSLDDSRCNKKRRRRIKAKEAQFHHTYVMKLFDRSVDLAQFKEDTPLYPICRAWMANQPRNANLIKSRKRSTSPDPDDVDVEEEEEVNTESDQGKVKKMYKLPPPLPFPLELAAQKKLRVPSPVPYERSEDINMDLEVKPSRDTLLRAHVLRWSAIRKKWHSTGHKNEARFADSATILKNIFKQAQTSFECTGT